MACSSEFNNAKKYHYENCKVWFRYKDNVDEDEKVIKTFKN